MTVATYITLSRLLAAILMLPFIYLQTVVGYGIATVLFMYAMASDVLDGYVARNFNQVTELGAKLDPLVDKILIYTMLFSMLQVNAISPILVFPMFMRDMIVDSMRNRAAESSNILGANFWGKAKFSFQAISIMCSLGFCMTGWAELVGVANTALLVALMVSIPGVLVIASEWNSGKTIPNFARRPSAPSPLVAVQADASAWRRNLQRHAR